MGGGGGLGVSSHLQPRAKAGGDGGHPVVGGCWGAALSLCRGGGGRVGESPRVVELSAMVGGGLCCTSGFISQQHLCGEGVETGGGGKEWKDA